MRYFILLPGDTEESVNYDTNILGESSFKNFWADRGLDILIKLVENHPDILTEVTIKDEKNKCYSIDEFLDTIKNLKVIRNG